MFLVDCSGTAAMRKRPDTKVQAGMGWRLEADEAGSSDEDSPHVDAALQHNPQNGSCKGRERENAAMQHRSCNSSALCVIRVAERGRVLVVW
jgi:hypothetical protein